MWERVVGLKGRKLETLGRPKPFTVEEVTQNGVEIRTSTGNVRYIHRSNLEKAWAELVQDKKLTLFDIRDHHDTANPAYIAPILAQMPGATVETEPMILLRYRAPE